MACKGVREVDESFGYLDGVSQQHHRGIERRHKLVSTRGSVRRQLVNSKGARLLRAVESGCGFSKDLDMFNWAADLGSAETLPQPPLRARRYWQTSSCLRTLGLVRMMRLHCKVRMDMVMPESRIMSRKPNSNFWNLASLHMIAKEWRPSSSLWMVLIGLSLYPCRSDMGATA